MKSKIKTTATRKQKLEAKVKRRIFEHINRFWEEGKEISIYKKKKTKICM